MESMPLNLMKFGRPYFAYFVVLGMGSITKRVCPKWHPWFELPYLSRSIDCHVHVDLECWKDSSEYEAVKSDAVAAA